MRLAMKGLQNSANWSAAIVSDCVIRTTQLVDICTRSLGLDACSRPCLFLLIAFVVLLYQLVLPIYLHIPLSTCVSFLLALPPAFFSVVHASPPIKNRWLLPRLVQFHPLMGDHFRQPQVEVKSAEEQRKKLKEVQQVQKKRAASWPP